MSGDKFTKEEMELMTMRQMEEHFEEEYIDMDVDD